MPVSAPSANAGTLVLIVGPSGAGKDTLIEFVRGRLAHCPDVTIVRRVVTRPSSPGNEDHDTMSEEEFERRRAEGAFAVAWNTHGLRYALPRSFENDLALGRVVLANVSRGVIAEARRRYPGSAVVHVTAPPHLLAQRLANRGREMTEDINKRLSRTSSYDLTADGVFVIENAGSVEQAGQRFISIIKNMAGRAPNATLSIIRI